MIWPAIDLMDGRCVRLHKGDFTRQSLYDENPLTRAEAFAEAGAKFLHVVDLDGARKGELCQSAMITRIATKTSLMVQAGGGIRTGKNIETLLEGGVARAIIGSLAVTDPRQVKTWLHDFGADRIVLALDVWIVDGTPRPAIRGWQKQAAMSLWEILEDYDGLATHLLVTDIDRDGVLQGANAALYTQIKARFPTLSLLGSGGVGSLKDITAIRAAAADGVIIGKALYENKFTLREALSCWPDA